MAPRALLSRLRLTPLLHHHHLRRFLSAATPPPDESPSGAPPPPSNSRLFVAGLSWSTDERSLKDAFSSFGTVTEVRIMYDKNSGRSRGFGFVHFSNDHEAKCAKDAMDGKVMLGRPLRISIALDKVRGAPVIVPRLSMKCNSTFQPWELSSKRYHNSVINGDEHSKGDEGYGCNSACRNFEIWSKVAVHDEMRSREKPWS